MISLLLPTPRQIGVYAAHGNPVAWEMIHALDLWNTHTQAERSRSWFGTWPTTEAERIQRVPPWGRSDASDAYVRAMVELQFETERMADKASDPMGLGLPVDGVCPFCDNNGITYSNVVPYSTVDPDEAFCDHCQQGAEMRRRGEHGR